MYLKRIITYSILSLTALSGFFGVHIENTSQNTSSASFQISIVNTYAVDTTTAAGVAAASAGNNKDTTSTDAVKKYNEMIDVLNIALAVLSAMVSPIILFVGWLMSPDWTSGDLFGLRAPMYALWVTVSNIVYFIYAILLILIALGTMFNQDKFSYKVMLPKLALGILMVPFTWWFVQWTVSIASVVTASVMTIPMETIEKNDSKWFTTASIPINIVMDSTGTGSATKAGECPGLCMSPKDFLSKAGGIYSPLIVYGYSIFKFEKIAHLDNTLDVATAALKIVHTSIVSTIMFAVFGLLVLALSAMLFIRAVKLWMYAIFAPLFTFRFVAGTNLMGGDDDSFSIKEFMGLAFVPAIVGLTLSFGLIMINAVSGPGSTATQTNTAKTCDLTNGECKITGLFGNPANSITRTLENYPGKDAFTKTVFQYADIKFIFLGKAVNQTSKESSAPGAIDAIGGKFGTIIVDVIALIFIWMAFMAAKNVSRAVKAAVQPFEDIGTSIGKFAKGMPKYMPLPVPGGSASGLQRTVDLSKQTFDSHMREKEEEKIGQFAPGLVQGLIKEQDRLKAKEKLKEGGKQNDYNHIQSTLGGLAAGAKSNQSNIGSLQKTMKEADVNRGELEKNILKDRSMSDELRLAAQKFTQEKELDAKETDLVMKWMQGKGGSTTGGSGGTTGGASGLIGGEKKNIVGDNYNINIASQPVAFKMDSTGKVSGISGLDQLKGKKAGMKEEDFIKVLQTEGKLTQEGAKALAIEIKNKEKDFFDTP